MNVQNLENALHSIFHDANVIQDERMMKAVLRAFITLEAYQQRQSGKLQLAIFGAEIVLDSLPDFGYTEQAEEIKKELQCK